jgi:ubiquitin-conjugating enzyme E2 S
MNEYWNTSRTTNSTNHLTGSSGSSAPSGMITKVLWRQQQELINKHPDGVTVIINQEDPLDIGAYIIGPKDTPYEGGTFRIRLIIPNDFPNSPPKGYFVTKIYHPNISEKGEICVNTLKKDWNPKGWSLYHVLEVIFNYI